MSTWPLLDGLAGGRLDRGALDGRRIAVATPVDTATERALELLAAAGVAVVTAAEAEVTIAERVVVAGAAVVDTIPIDATGWAQATVQSVLKLTNQRLAGKRVAVLGLDARGRALTRVVGGLGGRVVAVDADPERAFAALLDGHDIADRRHALAVADVVVSTDGVALDADDVARVRAGAVIAGTIAGDARAERTDEPRPGVTRSWHGTRDLYVLGDVPGPHRPIASLDLVWTVRLLVVEWLAGDHPGPGDHDVPADIRRDVATAALHARASGGPVSGATADVAAGRGMIEVARRSMPALAAAAAVARASGSLDGRRVGVALMLEPKTACLAQAIASVGADVAVFGNNFSTKREVVAALAADGVRVFAEAGATDERAGVLRDAFIDRRLEYLVDDGAGTTRRIHSARRDVLADLRGVAEETTSGVRPLRNMARDGALRVPCIAVNDARSKLRFDNVYGTGQSVVMAVADTTGVQLAGSRVVVVGYGRVGHGIAAVARAFGARVTVAEVDPVEALAAHHDGHDVSPLLDAVTAADVVITASGIGHTLTAEHVAVMRDGAVLAVGGAGWPEIDLTIGPPLAIGAEVRPHVRHLTTPTGAVVRFVADGHCANTTAGEGNPIEIMDLSLALQLRALDHLASSSLPPGVHLLPAEIDDEVAASQLAATGIAIDSPSAAQRAAAATW